MPIYAYRCESCGFAKDVLQKISDAPLTQCPSCGADAYRKQVTAAGFQLKGSGWYVTDFRGGNSNANNGGNSSGTSAAATGAKSGDAASSSSEGGKSEGSSQAAPAAAATTSAAPAASGTSGST